MIRVRLYEKGERRCSGAERCQLGTRSLGFEFKRSSLTDEVNASNRLSILIEQFEIVDSSLIASSSASSLNPNRSGSLNVIWTY